MILKKPFLLLIILCLFFSFSAFAQKEDSKKEADLSQLPVNQLVLRLFEYELEDEISPYHYMRLEFLRHDHVLNREGTVEYTELEDKLIDDVEDAYPVFETSDFTAEERVSAYRKIRKLLSKKELLI